MCVTDTQPQNPTQQEHQAFDTWILRVLVWLLGVITRLGAPRRSRLLHRIVRLCERNVEAMVFEMADARIAPLSVRPAHPRPAPRGFRLKRIRGCRFFSRARVRLSAAAGFAARVRHLLAVLARPERCIARVVAMLTRGWKRTSLIATAPVAERLQAQAFAAAFADSS